MTTADRRTARQSVVERARRATAWLVIAAASATGALTAAAAHATSATGASSTTGVPSTTRVPSTNHVPSTTAESHSPRHHQQPAAGSGLRFVPLLGSAQSNPGGPVAGSHAS